MDEVATDMAKIKFLTDTACDLPECYKELYDIEMIPISIVVDGVDYKNDANDDFTSFYKTLRTCKELPKTSQITTYTFVQYYKKLYDEGYTHIIGLYLPSFASGTYQNAILASEQFKEDYKEAQEMEIFTIDSLSYSLGYGLGLVEAAKKYQEGYTFEDLKDFIIQWTKEVEIYFSMYSLDFARRSGRLSSAAALVGDVLGIKPIMCVKDGKLSVYKKVRGKKAVVKEMGHIAKERMAKESFYAVLKGETEEEGQLLYDRIKEQCDYDSYGVYYAGPAVSINSGPEIVGMAFRGKKQ